MTKAITISKLEAGVDYVLNTVAGDIVLGIPLGVGKPNAFVNALYRRMKLHGQRRLHIVTALSLEKPVGHSDLEKHFLEPLVQRVFTDYPDLDYVKDARAGTLPPNITVAEFFMKTGDYLGNTQAQLNHISTNYTFAARDIVSQGINVMAQAVAVKEDGHAMRLSLSSNPDVTLELVEKMHAAGRALLLVGVLNRAMPFMPNGAEVVPDYFDVLITDPAATHAVFAPPNAKISMPDYAIGLHASTWVRDGGTLQIGIGSLGDAVGQALILRDRESEDYKKIIESLCLDGTEGRELDRFKVGVYGCSEMMVNAFLRLMEAGIVRREVYSDATLQSLCNQGRLRDGLVTPQLLQDLLQARCIRSPMDADDIAYLQRLGVLRHGVKITAGRLSCEGAECTNDLSDADSLDCIATHMLGARLTGGRCMTGGFFLGPRDFYEKLRSMPDQDLAKIDMTRIDFINQLYGDEALKRAQRQKACFINATMKVTLLGAAASDALESGQVVSGVGGQYNFVAMAHALPDARLLMLLRATHAGKDGIESNIVWRYGHTTIPRHLRDVVITEYGVADLRAQPDGEVVKRLLAIADSRFQAELIAQAQAMGKLESGYVLPERYRHNLPARIENKLNPWMELGLLPDFPFGTDLTNDELHMVRAMKQLQHASTHPAELLHMLAKSLWQPQQAPPAYLERLGLKEAHSLKDLLIRRLFTGNL